MQKSTLLFAAFSLLLILSLCSLAANAQVTAANYYYNNFDNGLFGNGFTETTSNSALQISATAPLSGTHSLTSTANGLSSTYKMPLVTENTNLDDETFGWEWTLLYRNNGAATDNSDAVDNGENAWKYWLSSNNANPATANGYFLTQNGNQISLRYRIYNGGYPYHDDLVSYSLPNNGVTYAIRVQRIKRQGQYVWHLFVDEYNSNAKNQASTSRGLSYHSSMNTYANSGFQISSTSANRFNFDEVKMYSMKLSISGANDTAYGINNPLYPGLENAAIYGLKIETRGYFDIYQLRISLTGNITGIVEGTMKLNKSKDAYFGNADDSHVANLDYYNDKIHNYNISDSFYSIGEADGSLSLAFYYYISVNVKASPANGATFSISGAPELNGSNSQANYANSGSVTNIGTAPTNTGSVRDWLGSVSSDWNNAANWSPNTVPGATDLAQIGVMSFDNQPRVSVNNMVGNIVFGTAKAAILTVGVGTKLTVNNNINSKSNATINGDGSVDVKGTYSSMSASSSTVTGSIALLTVNNLTVNSRDAAVGYVSSGGNTVIKNTLNILGADHLASFLLTNDAVVTFKGSNPISLSGNYSVSFADGTVGYASEVQQLVPVFGYKNISFAGAGVKKIASGTLYVSGNWSSSGGKVDLLSNNASLNFNGSNQVIEDFDSDAGNGISFGNLFFNGGVKTLSAAGKFNLAVSKYLTLGAHTTLQTSGSLTLKSNEFGSASVASIPASASIVGNVTVERYVQGGSKSMWRTYRMFSSPIYDNENAGHRTYSFTQLIDDMLITGRSEGFDQLGNSATSAWTYNNGFIAIPSINTAVDVGRGAYVLYRGDRSNPSGKVSTPYVDAESIVMTYKGELNQQSITVPLEHGSTGFSMLGNPYAATIDWNALTKTSNVGYVIRTWNPSNRQYATFNGMDQLNGGSQFIGPGQGFFVQTTDGNSPSVTFTEDAKVSDVAQALPKYNVVMAVRESNFVGEVAARVSNSIETPAKIRIKLTRDGYENEDETLVVFKRDELASFAGYDVERSGGEAVFLSSLSAEKTKMAINYMPHISSIQAVDLDVNVSNNGGYKMHFNLTGVPTGYEVKLKDKYLNTVTDLNNQETVYSLAIDRAVGSSLGDRFELLVGPATTLPVVLTDFTGDKANNGVLLKWKTSSELDNSLFAIQRAGDDQSFTTIATVNANTDGFYSFLDKTPLNGNNYYRLIQVDNNGTPSILPKILNFKFDLNGENGIVVYPTIVQSTFTIKFNGSLSSKEYMIKIADVAGKEVYRKKVSKDEMYAGSVGEFSAMPSGVYFATLFDINNGNRLGVTKLMKR
ncbi:hypothetical protein [Pedobacter xixiisoli]|uniref:Por secretion system C-terminal sorting domain-containing protein n=1 Tax=Pedobacter xixiisoli TaxID=1476464 RepID=A0A286A7P6_9SPHI|nr:hypothetical protein [Pedobacter xixiisoli]SOD17948.1 hypothetical protein SAMN06297358_2751 [Pedobacter xixiisoli]